MSRKTTRQPDSLEKFVDDCICTLCNCGACKCAPDIVQGKYVNILSEAQDQYRGKFQPAQRVNRQQYMHKPRSFEGTTTNQEDFKFFGQPQRRQASETARGNNNVFEYNLPFEGTTTAKHDFRKYNAKPTKSMKEQRTATYAPDSRNFQTENSSQYDLKNQGPRRSCAPELTSAPSLPFTGRTTNQSDFPRHRNPQRTISYQRNRPHRERPEDREFCSETKAQYIEKDFDVCPAKPLTKFAKECNGHVPVEQDMRGTWKVSQRLPVARAM